MKKCAKILIQQRCSLKKKDREKTLKLVEELRAKVAKIIADNPGIAVWNADQTGLVKEQHGKRTRARKGSRKVEALVQSISATSHSITLLPIIGYQKEKLFVQLGEPGGQLPQKGCFTHPSLEVAVAKSHMMSRETAIQFCKNNLFAGTLPSKILLILDSWPFFNDHQAIKDCCPAGTELFIVNIPPGATSYCQPADLSYNHVVKGVQRSVNSMVMIRRIPYRISERDNLLRFVSQLHWSLGADQFKPFISYGFYKGDSSLLILHPSSPQRNSSSEKVRRRLVRVVGVDSPAVPVA